MTKTGAAPKKVENLAESSVADVTMSRKSVRLPTTCGAGWLVVGWLGWLGVVRWSWRLLVVERRRRDGAPEVNSVANHLGVVGWLGVVGSRYCYGGQAMPQVAGGRKRAIRTRPYLGAR
jgi:hypothetical protein